MLACQVHDWAHITGIAKKVRHHDGFRSFRNLGGNRLGGDIIGERINVGKNRNCRLINNWRNGAHVGNRGGDDLVARLGIDGRDSRMNACCSRGGCAAECNTVLFGKPALKLLDQGAFGAIECAGGNGRFQKIKLFRAEVSPRGVGIAWKLHRPFLLSVIFCGMKFSGRSSWSK